MNESNDQKDLTLEQAVQIVVAGINTGKIPFPGTKAFEDDEVQKVYRQRVALSAQYMGPDVEKVIHGTHEEFASLRARWDAAYLRTLIFALANKELPERK